MSERSLACIAAMPTARRVAQLVWPSVEGNELVSRRAEIARLNVGGVVLMSWSSRSTAADLKALKEAGPIPLLVATDEEGGDVQRLDDLGALPSAAKVAASMSVEDAKAAIVAHAKAVKALGVDIVFAPVVDVSPTSGRGPIGKRAFSADPLLVSAFATAYVEAWKQEGILPVLKHFPGHGSATADTHKAGATTPPLAELRQRDLLPYDALRNSGAGVMVGHLTVPGLTEPGTPASLSPAAITGLLRGQLGFDNALVFTDALGMKAVTNDRTIPEAAVAAIFAGADVVVFTNTDQTDNVLEALTAAADAKLLSDDRVNGAVARVLATKGVDPCAIDG